MAKFIQAIREFGPKLKLNPTVSESDLVEWVAMRTGQTPGQVSWILRELSAAILYFTRLGTPVKLPGLGLFSPSISRHGQYRIKVRVDNALRKGINAEGAFKGLVLNRANIGLDNDGLKAMWDAAHPDDPLEL